MLLHAWYCSAAGLDAATWWRTSPPSQDSAAFALLLLQDVCGTCRRVHFLRTVRWHSGSDLNGRVCGGRGDGWENSTFARHCYSCCEGSRLSWPPDLRCVSLCWFAAPVTLPAGLEPSLDSYNILLLFSIPSYRSWRAPATCAACLCCVEPCGGGCCDHRGGARQQGVACVPPSPYISAVLLGHVG